MFRFLRYIFRLKRSSVSIMTDSGKEFNGNPESNNFYDRLNNFNRLILQEKKLKNIEYIWCLVGNVVDEHLFGEDKEIRKGTKQFSPGTKLYCFPAKWGDGYQKIQVIGRPRKFKGFIIVVIRSDYVTNWRKEKVYNPFIIKQMILNHGWDNTAASNERLNLLYDSLIEYQKNNKINK